LLDSHDRLAIQTVANHRGILVKSTGDGILATFDGPGRAVRCALASRRLRPSLGNGRPPDFHCKSVAIAPLAPYAPKAKIASERGEVPIRGTKQLLYQLLSLMFLTERENWSHTTSHISHN
jgi:hypothetical protein